METEKTITEVEVSAPSLADPIVAPEIEGVDAGEGTAHHDQVGEVPPELPLPSPLAPLEPAPIILEHHGILHSMAPDSMPQPGNETMVMLPLPETIEEITITDQDVLFGRGGLTNRHIGNLRYRDIISIHRQDYVRAQKTEKPNVARRIVKAIRTGKNPGRFLRKGEDARWSAVSDKEAAWKASQALREKSRWSSMKQEIKDEAEPPGVAEEAIRIVLEKTSAPTVEKAQKRKADEISDPNSASQGPEMKKVKAEENFALAKPMSNTQQLYPLTAMLTEISQITVPPVDTVGEKKVGANYMLPATMNTNARDIFPRDEDILFGRGGRTNHHPGNKRLRDIVLKYRDTYNQAKKVDKPKVSRLIVRALRGANPPSRFLRMNDETARWEEVDDKRAAEKVSQTLREKDREAKAEILARKSASKTEEDEAREAVLLAVAQAAAEVPVPEENKMTHAEYAAHVPLPSPEEGISLTSVDI